MQLRKRATIAALCAGLFAALTIFAGCSKANAQNKTAESEKEEAVTVYAVSTMTARTGDLQDYLEFGGDVTARTNVDITPDTTGRIAEIRVRPGDMVAKNQVVAMIDPSRPGMNYELSPVKAPIDGTITAITGVLGGLASPQLSLGKVGKIDNLEVSMNVSERFVSKIRAQQNAALRFDAYPGEIFPARVTEVSPVLDAVSRTMNVKLTLLTKDQRIKAGMFARVKLITDTRTNIVTIPEVALVKRFGETYVFAVEESETGTVARKKLVTAGIRVDDKTEIVNGLAGGTEIIIRGQTLLEDGSAVNVVSRASADDGAGK